VPVGVLLSGGVDSSLIVGLLKHTGQPNLNTFSVGFESVADEAGNEFKYSDIIAQRFETRHHKIFVSDEELLENLSACIAAMSEPMVSHDVIGFYLLSKEVSKHIKAVQSGQGADEVFGGYHWYPPLMNVEKAQGINTYKNVFFDRDFQEYQRVVTSPYLSRDFASEFVESHFNQAGASSAIDCGLRIDTTVMLVDDPVKRVDNMTMAWGIEARVPFLDHQFVELTARLPAQYKIQAGGKYLLKKIARKFVPSEVIDRPKGYFPVPKLKYLDGEYLNRVQEVLNQPQAKNRGIFNDSYLQELFTDPKNHITPLQGSKLWQIALLEYWLQLLHL